MNRARERERERERERATLNPYPKTPRNLAALLGFGPSIASDLGVKGCELKVPKGSLKGSFKQIYKGSIREGRET